MNIPGLELSDIQIKKLDEEDKMVDFAIKCTLINNSEDEDYLEIMIQGLDEDGFEVYMIDFYEKIPIGESKVLTTRGVNVKSKIFNSITSWQLQ